MSWGETLFLKKSIDKSKQELTEQIKSTKGLVASDNLYMPVITKEIKIGSYEVLDVLKINWHGSIKMKIRTSLGGSADSVPVYINGTYSGVSFAENSADTIDPVIVSNLNQGDVIGLKNNKTNSRTIYKLDIYADVIDLSSMDILIQE